MRTPSKVTLIAMTVLLAGALPLFAQEDVEGSRDHPLLTRMPNYYIDEYEEREFESFEFEVGSDKYQTVEGHRWVIGYNIKDDAQPAGELQVKRNFENAIKRVGGTVVYADRGRSTLKAIKDGNEVWVEVHVYSGATSYELTIIEKEAMRQDVVANADAWMGDINATGRAAVYGIYFDTDKAEIKAESEPTLAEIAKLLKNNPALNLHVVGHTDSTGAFDHNMKLSQARATSVMNALVSKYGIPTTRLQASGVGPLAPVASNDSEEGRAKNRRVELVKR
jgi:outer membrane protein OmpA-like peptidoglycan-associated protein